MVYDRIPVANVDYCDPGNARPGLVWNICCTRRTRVFSNTRWDLDNERIKPEIAGPQ